MAAVMNEKMSAIICPPVKLIFKLCWSPATYIHQKSSEADLLYLNNDE